MMAVRNSDDLPGGHRKGASFATLAVGATALLRIAAGIVAGVYLYALLFPLVGFDEDAAPKGLDPFWLLLPILVLGVFFSIFGWRVRWRPFLPSLIFVCIWYYLVTYA